MKIQIIKIDNWEALYIDGKQVCCGHSLAVEDVATAIVGSENVYTFSEWDWDEEISFDEEGNAYYDEIMYWENGEGCPQEWPFDS